MKLAVERLSNTSTATFIFFVLLIQLIAQSSVEARGVAFTLDQTIWKKAHVIYLKSLIKAEKKFGKTSTTYADFLTNLAIIDVIVGDKNALPLLTQAEAIRKNSRDEQADKILELQVMQADYLRESNKLADAAKLYEKCIEKVALSKNLKPGDYDATIDDLLNKYVICDGSYLKYSKDGTWHFGKANINLPHRMSRCSLGNSWHNRMIPLVNGYLLGADGKAALGNDLHSPKPWVPAEQF
ncbi:MAG: tetratricopeptide repeat protein [Candidatus Melainabacteria bacterium]|nr:tetratricopeptide repeat protein [Candidatus Melainabacteria bacterium]